VERNKYRPQQGEGWGRSSGMPRLVAHCGPNNLGAACPIRNVCRKSFRPYGASIHLMDVANAALGRLPDLKDYDPSIHRGWNKMATFEGVRTSMLHYGCKCLRSRCGANRRVLLCALSKSYWYPVRPKCQIVNAGLKCVYRAQKKAQTLKFVFSSVTFATMNFG